LAEAAATGAEVMAEVMGVEVTGVAITLAAVISVVATASAAGILAAGTPISLAEDAMVA
jgi:hypothetical protein